MKFPVIKSTMSPIQKPDSVAESCPSVRAIYTIQIVRMSGVMPSRETNRNKDVWARISNMEMKQYMINFLIISSVQVYFPGILVQNPVRLRQQIPAREKKNQRS